MSSALTVIVLGQAYFNLIPNNFTLPSNFTVPSNFIEVPTTTTEVPDSTLTTNFEDISTTTELPCTSTPTPNRETRWPDYTYIPGIGSHKVHGEAKNWDDARLVCKEEGGDLAVINSVTEAIIVGQLITKSQPHLNSEYSDLAHIGFGDREEEGQYRTIDGQTLSEAGYEQWETGEPNDGGDRWSTDDCGAITIGGMLVDANCIRHYAFVCELPGPAEDSK